MNQPTVVVTAGGNRVWLDPVRYLANASSGELGALISNRLLQQGCRVVHIAGPGAVMPSAADALTTIAVETPDELLRKLHGLKSEVSPAAWVQAMAVLDYQPAKPQTEKIASNQTELVLRLVPTPKVIEQIKTVFPDTRLVGFKLLTGEKLAELRQAAMDLAQRARCDLVVANFCPFAAPAQHAAYCWEVARQDWTGPYQGKGAIADRVVDWLRDCLSG